MDPSLVPKCVIGLGNPVERYAGTPHNVGRDLVERLASAGGRAWVPGKWYDHTPGVPAFVRLNSFMNVSGEPVARFLQCAGFDPRDMVVCTDDFDLPLGRIRIRKSGSPGTHNGLRSLVERLGTEDFPRLRLGIGPVPPGRQPADFVLEPFPEKFREEVEKMIRNAAEAVEMIVAAGLESAMNRYNASPSSPQI